jgi:type I restriction enzyme M protein
MKNTVEYLDALSTMTGTMTRSDALELFTLIAYLVKKRSKDESENILLSTQDNISTFISDFVAEKNYTGFQR